MVELRYINKRDARFLHKLRIDPDVLKNSRNTKPIPYENHYQWVCRAIDNPDIVAMVIWVDGKRAGQLNLTKITCTLCEVSISLSPKFRGKGVAKKALRIAHMTAKYEKYSHIHAEVKKCNTASLNLFKNEGYLVYLEKPQTITLIKEI